MNFSFQFIASYVEYSMEKLAGDLLFGLKFVNSPKLIHIFCLAELGRIKFVIFGLKG